MLSIVRVTLEALVLYFKVSTHLPLFSFYIHEHCVVDVGVMILVFTNKNVLNAGMHDNSLLYTCYASLQDQQ